MKTLLLKLLIPFGVSALALSFVVLEYYGAEKNRLPVYGPDNVNPELVDSSLLGFSGNHVVRDFNLINQNGEVITQKDYEGKIYVVDFFFTSCPTICPRMTQNMEVIQGEFIKDDTVKLLSLSVSPEVDDVAKLRQYADAKGVIDSKWNIATGDKKHIYELARKSYFAVLDEGDGGMQDFIHTSNFVLVDQHRQIRGIYDGLVDSEINRLINDIKTLAN